MARALLIGCGCHARVAGRALCERGWSVRGTTRRSDALPRIEDAGIDGVVADPDRVGTISGLVGDVTVLAWLLGSATGSEDELRALYEERLPSLLAALVDTPVRGFVFEAEGSVPEGLLTGGRAEIESLSARHMIPVRAITAARDGGGGEWACAVADAAESVLAGPR